MFSTIFLTILSISGPSGVISAGLLILTGTLLHYSSRQKSKNRSKKRNTSEQDIIDLDLKQKVLLTTELLKELERRENAFQNWFENNFEKLNQQKNQITVLLHSADQTAIQLNKMIDAFEKTFCAPQDSVVSAFNDLESNLKNEIRQLENSVASLNINPCDAKEKMTANLSNGRNQLQQKKDLAKKALNPVDFNPNNPLSQNNLDFVLDFCQTGKAA